MRRISELSLCLLKSIAVTVAVISILWIALFAVAEVIVLPPDYQPEDEVRVLSPTGGALDARPKKIQNNDLGEKQGTESLDLRGIVHFGELVDPDGSAALCLKCHPQMLRKSHKIRVKYPPKNRRAEVTYRPLSQVLGLGMKFEQGMVTCISCHDLTNLTKYQLALETRTSGHAQRLCYICHMEID